VEVHLNNLDYTVFLDFQSTMAWVSIPTLRSFTHPSIVA
jgi:hypothetical protein